MSDIDKTPGAFGWIDLTTNHTEALVPFYEKVIGWKSTGLSMGSYEDFVMSTEDGTGRAGICNNAGPNLGIPPFWMIYFNVKNLDESIREVEANGGKVVHGPREAGPSGRFCFIQDPAGAYCGLFEHAVVKE